MKLLPVLCVLTAISTSTQGALVAWYPFEEGTGNTANDASGNGNFLQSGGGNWVGSGAFGNSVRVGANYGSTWLARTGQFGSLTNLNATTGNKYSVSFWLKPDTESIGESPFYLGSSNNSAGNRLLTTHLEWYDGTTYFDSSWGDGTDQRISGNLGTVSDSLHHYVFTFNGDTGAMAIYKDGVSTITGTQGVEAAFPWGSIQNFEIGAFSFVAFWAGGQVDDFAIFNHVLSPAEINTARTQGIAALIPEPGSVALCGLGMLGLLRRRRK